LSQETFDEMCQLRQTMHDAIVTWTEQIGRPIDDFSIVVHNGLKPEARENLNKNISGLVVLVGYGNSAVGPNNYRAVLPTELCEAIKIMALARNIHGNVLNAMPNEILFIIMNAFLNHS
jgi:hypothetical protein